MALSRVLLNLTTNALKFTAEGFVEVVARQTGARRVEFSVRDTGRGIPPQSMATLFEPFRRRQKQGEYAFSGSGLGPLHLPQAGRGDGLHPRRSRPSRRAGTRFYFELDLPLAGETRSAEPLPTAYAPAKFLALAILRGGVLLREPATRPAAAQPKPGTAVRMATA